VRIGELEEMVQSQTEQVGFLAAQLQAVAERGGPKKEAELFQSYRDSKDFDKDDDWKAAKKIELPGKDTGAIDGDSFSQLQVSDSLDVSAAGASAFMGALASNNGEATALAPIGDAASPVLPPSRGVPRPPSRYADQPPSAVDPTLTSGVFAPMNRARMAQSLDTGQAKVKQCLAGFDVDHIIQCLATAIQNKLILSTGKRRPHAAAPDILSACAIFLEPSRKQKLSQPRSGSDMIDGSDLGSSISFCSALNGPGEGSRVLNDSLGQPVDPLNNIAKREVPNKWDVYGFLRDVMLGFRLQPEVSIVTLFYLDRFTEKSGVAVTPDNWQRLSIAAMMLASKVWDDESFENVDFAQLCPLYTLDEINAFERIFLKSVGYCMSVKGSEYAKTYFQLRTLGAKDHPEFGLQPLDPLRASRLQERCLEKQVEFRERYMDPEANTMNWTM